MFCDRTVIVCGQTYSDWRQGRNQTRFFDRHQHGHRPRTCRVRRQKMKVNAMTPATASDGHFHLAMFTRAKDVAMIFCVSSILGYVSHATSYAVLDSMINNQFALLRGQPMVWADGQVAYILPFYNRILWPGLFWIVAKLFGSIASLKILFTLLRFATYFVCLFAIFQAIKSRLDTAVCKYDQNELLIFISFSFIPSFFHPGLPGGDIIDCALCFAMFMFVIEGNFLFAFGLACLTAANRETGSFAGVLYLVLYYRREAWITYISKVLLLATTPYILAIIIRRTIIDVGSVTGQMITGFLTNIDFLGGWVRNPSPFGWLPLLLSMFFLSIFVFITSNNMKGERVRVFVALGVICGISATIGIIAEPRVFIPCLSLLYAATTARGRAIVGGLNARLES